MSTPRQSWLVSALALGALGLMVWGAVSPVWWVSLTAPNYPQEAFPDGIRIHFSFDGVSNGCTTAPKTSRVAQETQQEDLGWRSEAHEGAETPGQEAREHAAPKEGSPLDCTHEMNTINHYVGMHPMGVGAPVERLLAPFIIVFFGVLLIAFAVPWAKARPWVLGAGFLGVAGWMLVALYPLGGLERFIADFADEAGRYFRDPERIAAWGANVRLGTNVTVAMLVASMAFLAFGTVRWRSFQLVLGLVPAALPIFFVGSFAGWLWFFGHHLHPWGAFTLKPFMPTVFGDGKVAQFSTHSYPHYGFALLGAASVLALAAVVRRRWELMESTDAARPASPPPASPAGLSPASASKA